MPILVRQNEGACLKLILWDTAGSEKFRALIPAYVRDAQAVICVFDVTSTSSLEAVPEWLNFVEANASPSVKIYTVANKIDSDVNVEIPEAASRVSAHTGEGVQELFNRITHDAFIHQTLSDDPVTLRVTRVRLDQGQRLHSSKDRTWSSCC